MFIKSMLRTLYRNSTLLRRWWFWLNFVKNNRYIPNFKNPKTYNEKINYSLGAIATLFGARLTMMLATVLFYFKFKDQLQSI